MFEIQAFFVSYTFISNAWLKLVKIQAKAKQHSETELLLFENYLLFSSTLSTKMIRDIPKNVQKTSTSVLITLYD